MKRIFILGIAAISALPALGDSRVTSVGYVTDAVGAKQAKVSAQAGDFIVTYGATDGAIGSRPVVSELGESTTSTALPTAVAVEDPVYEKQSMTINLPNTNIVTYTGNEGTITSTPVYDSTTNTFSNGLVRASTLNTAVIDAVNGELTQVNENGQPDSNGTLWKIADSVTTLTTTAYLPANINGTSYCYKGGNGTNNYSGQCPSALYSGMQKGDWGAVFPYGNVTGISVCSSIAPTVTFPYWDGSGESGQWGHIATNQSGIQSEYDSWVSGGRPSTPAGVHCYCKLSSPSVAVSRWVFIRSYSSSSDCAVACAFYCGFRVQGDSDFRSGVFGAVAN